MLTKEDASRFYHVCHHCMAKWFSNAVSRCPRCGRQSLSTERLIPPWTFYQGASPPALPVSTGLSEKTSDKT